MREVISIGCLVLIASRVALVRKKWKQALEPDFPTLEVANRSHMEHKVAKLSPSILFVDEDLLGSSVRKNLFSIQRLCSATRIIVLTCRPEQTTEIAVLQSGAWGYCHRDLAPSLIRKMIQMVQKGELWFTRSIVRELVHRPVISDDHKGQSHTRFSLKDVKGLTDRQREIALGIARGTSNKQVADDLHITESTVKAHLTIIFRKLGVSDRLTLALLVREKFHISNGHASPADGINGNGHY